MHDDHGPKPPEKQTSNPNPPADNQAIMLDEAGRPLKPRWWQAHHHWHHLSRRQKLIAGFLVIMVLALLVFGALGVKQALAPNSQSAAKADIITSPLTGLPVTAKQAARPVTGIMIENSVDARPQSGLKDAGVVFEAIAEGGITRFLALYQEAEPQYIGPVRSLRPYYLDWAKPFDASIAHVGGSPQALSRIRSSGKDLDQFFNAGAYQRVIGRPSPHNVYTSFKQLDALNKAKGFKESKFTSWGRKADSPGQKPKVASVNLLVSGPDFNVKYKYNRKTNTYQRQVGGQNHKSTRNASPKTAKQINPKVVIALVVGFGIASDGHHSDYQTTGRGRAFIFQDGEVIKGSWVKPERASQIKFVTKKGATIRLNAGQTWITVVDAPTDIRYSH